MSAMSRPALVAAPTVLTLALTLALAGCGGTGEEFAPACPRPAILGDAASLQHYRGAGRDFLDTVLQGQVVSLNGSCRQDGRSAVATTISVGIELQRGPAATGREADIPFFVAVSEGDRVLDKQVYSVHAVFPPNTDRLRLTGDSVDLRLPVSDSKKADAYQISVGFQLTPAELATNRAQGARGR